VLTKNCSDCSGAEAITIIAATAVSEGEGAGWAGGSIGWGAVARGATV